MEFLSRVLKGLVVGVANIIPGVSGGTMAVVMGIYDRLIGAVSDLRRDFKNSLLYLFPIGIGAVLGIVLFSHLIKFLLEGYPMPTNLFFLGLILGSIPMIFRRARKESFQKSSLLPFAVSFAVMLLMTIFQNVSDASSALITTLTPLTAIRLLLSAAVAAACMIMPGISGSMVMVLLGVYTSVLTAISDLNIPLWTAPDAVNSPTVTAARVPVGFTWPEWKAALAAHGLVVGGSLGPMNGKVFRLGHMGTQADAHRMASALAVMEEVLKTR